VQRRGPRGDGYHQSDEEGGENREAGTGREHPVEARAATELLAGVDVHIRQARAKAFEHLTGPNSRRDRHQDVSELVFAGLRPGVVQGILERGVDKRGGGKGAKATRESHNTSTMGT